MKATEQYFPVVLFIMLYKVVLTFDPVDEVLKCNHSNESYWAVPSCGPTIYYAVQGGWTSNPEDGGGVGVDKQVTVNVDNNMCTVSRLCNFINNRLSKH